MKCEEIKGLIPDYLNGTLKAGIRTQLEEHISGCPGCRQEIEAMNLVWTTMGNIPEEEPDPSMSARFYSMLETYRHGMNSARENVSWIDTVNTWLERWWPRRPVYQIGLTIAVLIFGIGISQWINVSLRKNSEIAQLKEEMAGMRGLVTISLLNQPSAVDRLQGVYMSRMIDEPDDKFLSALVYTLNNDPNVNVRLAAADALQRFSGSERIRTDLVESLSRQTSPLVQITLINLLVELREQKAISAFQKILEDKQSIEPVKERARLGIDTII
jgi:hypothetical protein